MSSLTVGGCFWHSNPTTPCRHFPPIIPCPIWCLWTSLLMYVVRKIGPSQDTWFLKGVNRFASWLKSIIWILCLFMYNFYFSINSVCWHCFLCAVHTRHLSKLPKTLFLCGKGASCSPTGSLQVIWEIWASPISCMLISILYTRNLTFIGYVEWAVPHRRSKTLLGSQVWLC